MRIVVHIAVLADELALLAESAGDEGVGLEDVGSGWSSSPKPGARWTTPVPSEVSTKSAASTLKAPSWPAKKSKSGS
jgi:hypothetical protein